LCVAPDANLHVHLHRRAGLRQHWRRHHHKRHAAREDHRRWYTAPTSSISTCSGAGGTSRSSETHGL
jgi:hypothetical protein